MRVNEQTIAATTAPTPSRPSVATPLPTARAILVGGLLALVGWSLSARHRRAADAALDAADVERFDSDLG
jgi:hypothetical protein